MWPYEYDERANGVCLLGVNMCNGFTFAKGGPDAIGSLYQGNNQVRKWKEYSWIVRKFN